MATELLSRRALDSKPFEFGRNEGSCRFPFSGALSMRAGRGSGVFGRLVEEPDRAGAEESKKRSPAEDIDVGEQSGLLFHEAVKKSHGAGAALRAPEMMAEVAGDRGGSLLQNEVGGIEMRSDFILVKCGAADERGGGHRDSDRAADVAQHVEEAGCASHLFTRNGGGGHGGEGNEDEAEREAGQHDGQQQGERSDLKID